MIEIKNPQFLSLGTIVQDSEGNYGIVESSDGINLPTILYPDKKKEQRGILYHSSREKAIESIESQIESLRDTLVKYKIFFK